MNFPVDKSEASGDENSRNNKIGSLHNNAEETLTKESIQKKSSTTINQPNIDEDSQPRWISAQVEAENFLTDRKIFELFNFLIGHLLVDEPDDPVEYLHDLLDKCMLFRSGLAEPPLIFDTRHIESIFRSLDPSSLGDISIDQYKSGLETLGIGSYDPKPRESTPGRVDKNTFTNEAKSCLVRMLSEMIGKSI